MGTFAKRLGQLTAKSLESESRNIIRTCAANKQPGSLSLALDGTLKQGHDMRVFGLGTAASMASRERYARFTASMHAVYGAMEEELDRSAVISPAIGAAWSRHGATLRRAKALQADLADVLGGAEAASAASSAAAAPLAQGGTSPATARYVAGIREAGASDRAAGAGGAQSHGTGGGARLLGHLYCRYFADLFGGQMLAGPTRAALALDAGTPRHYTFDLPESGGRRALIEEVYLSLNEAGALLSEEAFDAVVQESFKAFGHNVDVYSEEPIWLDAARGSFNICAGYARQAVRGH